MTDPYSDNYLMTKVKEGDLDKLGLLFERYHKMLYVFFYRMNLNQELSEDLVQEVFERIMKYRNSFKGDGSFKAWIFHIARNINYDHHKKNKDAKNQGRLDDWEDQLSDHAEAGAAAQKEREMQILEISINNLPEDKRELIVLSKLKGMKYREIGELMNLSEGTVKVRIFRALKDLQKKYVEIEKMSA